MRASVANSKRSILSRSWSNAFILVALSLQVAVIVWGQSLNGTPVKIDVVNESSWVTAGARARLRVNLLDPENRPANASKDFKVEIQGRLPSGNTEISTVVVKAGNSSGTVELPAKEPGLLKVVGSNRELASGGTILNVRATQ